MSEKMVTPELFRPPVDFPDVPYDHLLRAAAGRAPERPAIIYHDLILTYREVVSMVNCIANGLHNLGMEKGDRICLFTTNRPEYTVTFIAAASVGIVVSPMNPGYKEREIAYQLENSEARAILIQRELLPLLQLVLSQKSFPHLKYILVTGNHVPESMPEAIPFARLMRESSPKHPPHVEVSADDLLALPYSSGTTGFPKGTLLTHRNLASNNLQFTTALGTSITDVALIFLPFYHIYGVMLTGGFLACGGTQVIMERFDLLQSLELCEKHGVTYYFAVPPIVLALANAPVDLSRMKTVKYVFTGAAPLPLDPARKLEQKADIKVVQGYGMTEASPLTGEIIIRGPQVMQGYWKAPEETARALRDGWLYTGDIGHVDADGFTYIVDRKKEMIKYKGFGIAPAELESLLMEHPAVLDSAVIGIPDDEAGEVPKGFVVIRKGFDVTPEEIVAFANGKLAGYKKIHSVEFIEAIPKVASGKILRRELKDLEKARRAGEL
ncbi:MAG: long-chain fatty acid--CoA ligase [Chloroflexi bacterium]|nr:MAG: long-chain fatty acid--CoA ligase [Chloroflexota bacterium]